MDVGSIASVTDGPETQQQQEEGGGGGEYGDWQGDGSWPTESEEETGSKGKSTGLREKGKARASATTVARRGTTLHSAPTHRRKGKGKGA